DELAAVHGAVADQDDPAVDGEYEVLHFDAGIPVELVTESNVESRKSESNMPANETTWRNTQQLHRIFAVTGVLLTISTVWMVWKDHARSWKTYQVQTTDVDL